ncbi:hypothetical protein [Enterococcus sp. BWR-S5]|nr:hypothetical protein [Enterococcus sp. BWR-S5]
MRESDFLKILLILLMIATMYLLMQQKGITFSELIEFMMYSLSD